MKKSLFCFLGLLVAALFYISHSTAFADSLLTTATTDSGPYAFATLGTKVYVTNNNTNTVTSIDTSNNFATSTIVVGAQPKGIVALGTKLYVANYASGTVSVIDTGNNNAVTTVAGVGNGPQYLLAFGSKVYVSNVTDGTVTVIDPGSGYATSSISVGPQPNGLLAIGSKIYVAHTGGGASIYVIDTASGNATSSILATSSYYLAAVGTTLYAPDFSTHVSIVDIAHGNATSSVLVSSQAYSIATLGSKVYVTGNAGDLSVIDSANNNAVSTVVSSVSPQFVAVLGTKVYYVNSSSGGTLSSVDTVNNNVRTNFPSTGSPQQIATLSPYIFVANTTAGHVSIYVQQYTLNYIAGSNGSITGSSTQIVYTGSSGSAVTAVPAAGYHFVNWSDASTANPRTDASVTGDVSVTANFAANPVVVVPSSASNLGGTASISDLAKILAPGPATDAYLASRGYKVATSPTTSNSDIATGLGLRSELGLGSVGPDVTKLQKYLNTHNFMIASSGAGSLGKETDRFGLGTYNALKRFQKASGIPATGHVGPMTRKMLNQ